MSALNIHFAQHSSRTSRHGVKKKDATLCSSKVRFNELYQLLSIVAMPPREAVKVLVSIMMSVSLSNNGKHWRWDTTTSTEHISKEQPRDSFTSNVPQRIVRSMAKTKLADWSRGMYGTQDASHIWQLDHVNLICGDLGGFLIGKHRAAVFHNPLQDVRMAVHGDDSVCLSDDDGLKHIDGLLKSKYPAKDMGTLGFEDTDVKSLLLFE